MLQSRETILAQLVHEERSHVWLSQTRLERHTRSHVQRIQVECEDYHEQGGGGDLICPLVKSDERTGLVSPGRGNQTTLTTENALWNKALQSISALKSLCRSREVTAAVDLALVQRLFILVLEWTAKRQERTNTHARTNTHTNVHTFSLSLSLYIYIYIYIYILKLWSQ